MLKPYGQTVLVQDSSVEEFERPSGLVVPVETEMDVQITRAVLIDCSEEVERPIPRGAVIYYSRAVAHDVLVNGVRIVSVRAIIAWEDDDE